MNEELAKSYSPNDIESKWRTHWEASQTFTANPSATGEPYCIVIPPPNVTGSLHIGHALNITLQDILCRHARQLGKNVVWIPGTDHAGIATQNVVERTLAKEGKSRDDLGRDTFIQEVWKWKEQYGNTILHQVRMLGASVDWTRERFTMDEGLSKAVRTVFTTLYNDGLIYKDTYSINWCIRCSTALADDEVEHEARKGFLWSICYPVVDSNERITVATTRPETLLGDTAICVHPEDERYQHLIGKHVHVPLTERTIPIIADTYVDREFGTGALKVTPAHDRNDWLLGKTHNLACLQVIDTFGIMNEHAGIYKGLDRDIARSTIVHDLEKQGFLVETSTLENTVGCCYRCKTVIEPYVSEQWFVATTKLAPTARNAVPKDTQIFPEQWVKTYHIWLDSMRDWCISRQIWWGHRIPAWECSACHKITVAIEDPTHCSHCNSSDIAQETDVLDTWFSSALWPFSTLGYPEKTPELEKYYPTAVLVTGFDILFFWVARMMMMGQYFMKEVPFKHVYIHALVRDSDGKKMSKSTGNVIDPLAMIEKYGTDSLRFTLTSFAAMGRDIKLSEERIEGYRHFINKLWNASRFVKMNCADTTHLQLPKAIEDVHHLWILQRLNAVKKDIAQALEDYQFNEVAHILYSFIWNDYCDWYLEFVKFDMKTDNAKDSKNILLFVLQESLILLHPIIPFCTAEIFASLPHNEGKDIAKELYPLCTTLDNAQCEKALIHMTYLQDVLTAIRSMRAELHIAPTIKLHVCIETVDAEHQSVLEQYRIQITSLARLEVFEITGEKEYATSIVDNEGGSKGGNALYKEYPTTSVDNEGGSKGGNALYKEWATSIVDNDTIAISLSGIVDISKEVLRLEKEINELTKDYQKVSSKLSNKDFTEKAPQEIIQKEQEKQEEIQRKIARFTELYEQLRG